MSERPNVVVTDAGQPSPPGAELAARIAGMRPVATRNALREAAWIAALGLGWTALLVAVLHPRSDLPALPMFRFGLGLASWAAVAMLGVTMVLRPERGQVLPSLAATRLTVLGLPLVAVTLALLFLVDAPSRTQHLEGAARDAKMLHCFALGIGAALLPLILLMIATRRLPSGHGWIGAGLGVACGALGALMLHLVCPVGGAAHVLTGHASAMVGGGLLGALLARGISSR